MFHQKFEEADKTISAQEKFLRYATAPRSGSIGRQTFIVRTSTVQHFDQAGRNKLT